MDMNRLKNAKNMFNNESLMDANPLTDMLNASSVDDNAGPARRRPAMWMDDDDYDNFDFGNDSRPTTRPRTMMSVRPVTAMTMSEDMTRSIPDLDSDDFPQKPADAPHVLVNKLASYQELQKELLKSTAFSSLDNIDLSCLIKKIVPKEETKEEEEPWTWDNLISDISAQLPEMSGIERD
ncbi:Intraflagellar transport protein 43 -like protein B [Halotydeus destructor]|nr:Intraflagellar transport protein 43 -like protein B [Halotydeus destructor]